MDLQKTPAGDNLLYAVKFSEIKTDTGEFVRPNWYHPSYWPDDPVSLDFQRFASYYLKSKGVICWYTRITGNLLETYQIYATKELAVQATLLKSQCCKFINIYNADLEQQELGTDHDFVKFLEYSKYRFTVNAKKFGYYEQIYNTDVHELTLQDLEGFTKYND